MLELFEEVFRDVPGEFWPAMVHVLWRVDYGDPVAAAYSILNLLEALAWFGVAGWVIRRRLRRGRSRIEWVYAGLFVAFGLTDVVESQLVPIWLIAVKGMIFGGILGVRWIVVKRCYPGAKM